MKRLVSLAVFVAFLVAIPQCFGQDDGQSPAQLLEQQQLVQMFHLVMVQRSETGICHITSRGTFPAEGVILFVNDTARIQHLNHGDCADYDAATVDESGRSCACQLCPGGEIPPCQ